MTQMTATTKGTVTTAADFSPSLFSFFLFSLPNSNVKYRSAIKLLREPLFKDFFLQA